MRADRRSSCWRSSAATGLAVAAVLLTPPPYEADASLIVRIGREYVYRPEVGTGTARNPSLGEIVNSEVEILSSPDLAEQVVRTLGVTTLYPDLADETDPEVAVKKAMLSFRADATVRPVLDSSVIKVGFAHEVPQVAADAVNLLVDRFTDKHVEVFSEESSNRVEEELAARSAALARAEDALADFKSEHGVFDVAGQLAQMLGQRARLEDALGDCEVQIRELEQRLGPAQQVDSAEPLPLPPFLQPEMTVELLRQLHELERELRELVPPPTDRLMEEGSLRLLDLEQQEQQLRLKYSDTNRQVQGIRNEIESVRNFLSDAERRSGQVDEAFAADRQARKAELEKEIERLTREIELLDRQRLRALGLQRDGYRDRLAAIGRGILDLNQQEVTLRRLERERQAAESAEAVYREKVEDARAAEELDREKQINVRVIARATAPVMPTGLPPKLEIACGAMAGLLAGAGVAVLTDLFRSR